jgi:hypothetical protein
MSPSRSLVEVGVTKHPAASESRGANPSIRNACHPIATTEFPKVESAKELKGEPIKLKHGHLKRRLPVASHAARADTGSQVYPRVRLK